MNTREDLLKWLDDNRAFKDPERKTLSSSIVRTLNKNENIKKDFKRVARLDSDNSTELIYNIVFPNQARVCEVCGKPVKFSAYYLGYKKTCSLSCAGKIANQKGAPVKLKKYGSVNNRKKVEETKLERYGDPNYNNWSKSRETKQEKYGDPNYNNINKARETSLQKYGVDNVSKLPATIGKMKATNLERRGIEFPSQDPGVIKKMRESSKKKYVYEGMSFGSSWELAFYIMNKGVRMEKSEYIKTITIKDQEIHIGKDDYGQCYFIEWVDDKGSHGMGLGTYNKYIMEDLLYIFDPDYCELMRRIYLNETLTDEELERKAYYEKLIEAM